MKRFASAWIVAMLFASQAHAVLTCFDRTEADTGYLMEIAGSRDSVIIKTVNFAGATVVETLPCTRLQSDPLTLAPGADVMVCRRTDIVDYGFTATIKSLNCTGQIEARLDHHSIAGTRPVAQMTCADRP
ncbi:MAG: hypothetical protein NDI61_11035 [Bdellovibrionaceae bacterium]|nr:hypothetical protein [Pseudobdellovibrionaceae bacterium]